MKKIFNIKLITAAVLLSGAVIAAVSFLPGCEASYSSQLEGEEYARLTYAPLVPPPISRDYPTKVIVNLETKEVTRRLADGVEYTFWTFGGDVPGKFIRVREGDLVEFHLHNAPGNKMPHNIDLHSVTGPGGGAEASFTAPGYSSVFSFTVKNPGLYIYHCATAPVGLHIANGMYGLMLVEPEEGLPPVDREYYVVQSEFYTQGRNGEPGIQPFSQQKAVDEEPEYVVFNGSVGAIAGDKALPAKVGETIRLFIGNGGPNLVSSFHVIGEIFDKVYGEGGTTVNQENVQTTLVPAGGSAIVEFKIDVPGTFILVDHSIFRAFHKGTIGMIKAEGEKNLAIYSHKQKEDVYFGSDIKEELWSGDSRNLAANVDPDKKAANEPAGFDMGKSVYTNTCQPCHQPDGSGLAGVFPPLAASDFLNKNKEASIAAVVKGLQGPITVNGKKYNSVMLPQNLTDEQTAAVLNYVYKSWGNSGQKVTADEVAKIKGSKVASK